MPTAKNPKPPYYAVIFTSRRGGRGAGYREAAARMEALARRQPGFLGMESVSDGASGITVSYWESREAIAAWRADGEHRSVQERGRGEWYRGYTVRVARVEREYRFGKRYGGKDERG